MMVTTVVTSKRSKKPRAAVVTGKPERLAVFDAYGTRYVEAVIAEDTRRERSHARVTLRLEDLRAMLAEADALASGGDVIKV